MITAFGGGAEVLEWIWEFYGVFNVFSLFRAVWILALTCRLPKPVPGPPLGVRTFVSKLWGAEFAHHPHRSGTGGRWKDLKI